MMRRLSLPSLVSAVMVIGGFLQIASLNAELIEPTRTLQGTLHQPGLLSVYSEPPGLDVWVDGKSTGKTPLISFQLPAGEHLLRLGDTELKISIAPEKAAAYSWFKGTLIEVAEPSETQGVVTAADSRTGKKTTPKVPEPVQKKELRPNDPFYWPLNPRGPIN
jgi:hypothetical protein